tara:strand:+ start:15468 stop:16088 length:621 start_codon:yes stop_codon:yes gene_type:complete
MRTFCVGLTGGIGVGKSTVANMFQTLGASVIDVDAVGHSVLDRSSSEYLDILETFGEKILNPDGTINRTALGKIVFSSEGQLAKLEAITHPAINKRLLSMLEKQTAKLTILDMAVLVEQPLAQISGVPLYQKVIVVEATYQRRIERLQLRGLEEEEAHARMQSQATDEERRRVADLIISNDNSLEDLQLEIMSCWETVFDWMNDWT